jgi:hypothetical protein
MRRSVRSVCLITAVVLAVVPLTAAGATVRAAPPVRLSPAALDRLFAADGPTGPWLARETSALPGLARLERSKGGRPQFSLQTGSLRVRGGGHAWELSASIFGGGSGPALAEVDLSATHGHGGELHSWEFADMPQRDASFHAATGRVSVDSGASLSPVAGLSLTFRPASHARATCASADFNGTVYTGSVTGTIRLVTGLDGVRFRRVDVRFGRSSSVDVYRGGNCQGPDTCTWDDWFLGGRPGVLALGLQAGPPGRKVFTAGLATDTVLSKSRQIDRIDVAAMTTAVPAFSKRRHRLVITTSRTGLITGSAVIRHAVSQGPESSPCTVGKTRYSVRTDGYFGRYASAAGQRIVAHMYLAPTWLARSGPGAFDIVTSIRRQK